jgi:hypothetical protein
MADTNHTTGSTLWRGLRRLDAELRLKPYEPPPPPPPWDGKIPMFGPLPKEALHNMPGWISRLDDVAGWLCVPFTIAYGLALLYQYTGIMIP